jgi:hypothetical protein
LKRLALCYAFLFRSKHCPKMDHSETNQAVREEAVHAVVAKTWILSYDSQRILDGPISIEN